MRLLKARANQTQIYRPPLRQVCLLNIFCVSLRRMSIKESSMLHLDLRITICCFTNDRGWFLHILVSLLDMYISLSPVLLSSAEPAISFALLQKDPGAESVDHLDL